jgi:ribosomal protein S18 acetylase RimI-like enzyme
MTEILREIGEPQPINADFVTSHLDEFYELVKLIPEVTYTKEDLLAEAKADGRILHAKWQHSYALTEGDKVVGFVMGYEREAEDNINYPKSTLYISELAVAPEHQGQGYGRKLLGHLLNDAIQHGFIELTGPLNFTVQTNAADWNGPVRTLYKSLGFSEVGYKRYENRSDVVMKASSTSTLL